MQHQGSLSQGSIPDAASIRRAHQRFLDTGEIPRGVVPEVIQRSWVRCAGAGVPNERLQDIARLEAHRVRAELERHHDLIAAAEPVMDMLHVQLEHTGAILILCAPDGLILRSMGDPAFVPQAERVALQPGVCWSEAYKGTNGIGTAIVEREPVVVYGAHHYVRQNHFLACSATPVFEPCGDLAAVLDITGDYRSHHAHTLALARMAGRSIERQLFLRKHEGDIVLHTHPNPHYLGSLFDARMAFSEDGRFLGAEVSAREMLGIAERRAIGSFEELFDASFVQTRDRLEALDGVVQLGLRSSGAVLHARFARGLRRARVTSAPAGATGAGESAPAAQRERLADIELQAIRAAVSAHQGNISAAAKQLGIGRATLYRKLKTGAPQARDPQEAGAGA